MATRSLPLSTVSARSAFSTATIRRGSPSISGRVAVRYCRRHFCAGIAYQGPDDAFDGYGWSDGRRTPYQPSKLTYSMADNGQSVITGGDTVAGSTVSREITVPDSDGQDFARTVDTFTNSSGSPITATVQIVGTWLRRRIPRCSPPPMAPASSARTTSGSAPTTGLAPPAIIHYIHGPLGLKPVR